MLASPDNVASGPQQAHGPQQSTNYGAAPQEAAMQQLSITDAQPTVALWPPPKPPLSTTVVDSQTLPGGPSPCTQSTLAAGPKPLNSLCLHTSKSTRCQSAQEQHSTSYTHDAIVEHDALILSGLQPIRTSPNTRPSPHPIHNHLSCPQLPLPTLPLRLSTGATASALSTHAALEVAAPANNSAQGTAVPVDGPALLAQKLAEAEQEVLGRRLSSLRSAAQAPESLNMLWGSGMSSVAAATDEPATPRAAPTRHLAAGPRLSLGATADRPSNSDKLASIIRATSIKLLPLSMAAPDASQHAPAYPPTCTSPTKRAPASAATGDDVQKHRTCDVSAAYALLANLDNSDAGLPDQGLRSSPFACQTGSDLTQGDSPESSLRSSLHGALTPTAAAMRGDAPWSTSSHDWRLGPESLLALHAGMDAGYGMPQEPFTPTAAAAAAASAGAQHILEVYEQQVAAHTEEMVL